MPTRFEYTFDTPVYKGSTSFETGLFINGKLVDGSDSRTIDVINPATGKVIASVSEGTPQDVDEAVKAAQHAYETVWGLRASGLERSNILWKLPQLMEANAHELAALESLNNGKTFETALRGDLDIAIKGLKYYAGWANKLSGKTLEAPFNPS